RAPATGSSAVAEPTRPETGKEGASARAPGARAVNNASGARRRRLRPIIANAPRSGGFGCAFSPSLRRYQPDQVRGCDLRPWTATPRLRGLVWRARTLGVKPRRAGGGAAAEDP